MSGLIPSSLFPVMAVQNLKRFCCIFSEKKANSSLHFCLCQKKQKGIIMTIDSLKSWGSLCAIKKNGCSDKQKPLHKKHITCNSPSEIHPYQYPSTIDFTKRRLYVQPYIAANGYSRKEKAREICGCVCGQTLQIRFHDTISSAYMREEKCL